MTELTRKQQKHTDLFFTKATKTYEGMLVLDLTIEDFFYVPISIKTLRRYLNCEGYKTKNINDILYAIPSKCNWGSYD